METVEGVGREERGGECMLVCFQSEDSQRARGAGGV